MYNAAAISFSHLNALMSAGNVTQILDAVERGERQAAEQLLPLVYAELRRLAEQKMSHEAAGRASPVRAATRPL